ncbi:MAG: alanine:cation symporter family protein [Clostridia bacterium]|nr:alanine:cation symporter family protein [Clostridia bacterium]
MLDQIIGFLNDALYSYILVIILVLGGIFFTVRTKGVQFRLFKEQIRCVSEKPSKKGAVSSFQALMVSTASRVGTGNIIGVSTAICLGGFGSVFWMWLIAIVGSASAFVESTLAQIFKKKGNDGESYGGPAYYISAALKSRWLAVVFSVFLILTYGIGFNMLASYNLQSTFSAYEFYNVNVSFNLFGNEIAFNVIPWLIGLLIAGLVAFCLFGGGKRIINATTFIVPVMGVAYILVALIITIINIPQLPSVFLRIFTEAFNFEAIFGGFSGSCLMFGIKRGLFSNEAGVGSAPNASASAHVSHPVKQGLVQILSVFIDTLLICTASAFMCMCSGVEPTAEISGAQYVQLSLKATLGEAGPIFITVAMALFAFTTLIGNLFYVDKAIKFIFGKEPTKAFMTVYHIIASLLIFVGAGLSADLLWNISDVLMGGMALINMPVIFILGKYVYEALNDYVKQRKEGKDPLFKAKDINLPVETDYWNE